MPRFDGRAVLVTGAAQGMGRAIAERFLEEGAAVTLFDLDAETVEATAAELRGKGTGAAVAGGGRGGGGGGGGGRGGGRRAGGARPCAAPATRAWRSAVGWTCWRRRPGS